MHDPLVDEALEVARRRFPRSPLHAQAELPAPLEAPEQPAPLEPTPAAPRLLGDRVAFPVWVAVQAGGLLVLVAGLLLAL